MGFLGIFKGAYIFGGCYGEGPPFHCETLAPPSGHMRNQPNTTLSAERSLHPESGINRRDETAMEEDHFL